MQSLDDNVVRLTHAIPLYVRADGLPPAKLRAGDVIYVIEYPFLGWSVTFKKDLVLALTRLGVFVVFRCDVK